MAVRRRGVVVGTHQQDERERFTVKPGEGDDRQFIRAMARLLRHVRDERKTEGAKEVKEALTARRGG